MNVWLLMAAVITHARTARVPFSVSAAGVSVWTRTGTPAFVSISNHVKESGRAGISPETCQQKTWQTVVAILQKNILCTKSLLIVSVKELILWKIRLKFEMWSKCSMTLE